MNVLLTKRPSPEHALSYFENDPAEVRMKVHRLSTEPARIRAWGWAIATVVAAAISAVALAAYRGWL